MDPDPVTANAILRLIVISQVAALVPLLGALLTGTDLSGEPLLLGAMASMLGGLTLAEIELARQRDQPASLPAWPVSLASLVLLTLALTLADSALPADVGWYGVMLVLPVLVAAFIGRPAFVAVVTGAAIAGFVVSMSVARQHGGHEAGAIFGFISFALIAACAAGMLARAIARDRDELACLAEVAAIAARAMTIEAGFAGAAEAIARGPVSGGRLDHVAVLRYDGRQRAHLGLATLTWHDDDPTSEPAGLMGAEALEEAVADDGVSIDPGGARIVADDLGRVRYVLDIRLATTGSRRRVDPGLWRAHLARLALHLRVLVERVHALDELDQISPVDELTGLPNRRSVLRDLELTRSEAVKTGGQLSVALVDLDDFADYLDRFGPPEGDRLINDLAAMLAARVRSTDLVARYDGAVFCLVLPTTGAKGALRLVDELHTWAALLRPGQPITFSAGVADWDDAEPIRSLLSRAERALRQAQADGKDRTVLAPTEAESGDNTSDHAAAG